MKKTVIIIGSIFLLLIFGILITILLHSPQYNGDKKITGLKEEVEVIFDKFGVPHIYAQNPLDAYRALGYVQAQDRLFQMEMMRRVGSGTLSELLGPEVLDIDKFFRTIGIPKHARESNEVFIKSGDSPWKSAAEAYAAGVNEFINSGRLPIEYSLLGSKPEKFSTADMHAITGYMAFTFAMSIKTDPLVTKMARELGEKYLAALSVQTLPEHHKIELNYPDSLLTPTLTGSTLMTMLDKLPVPLLEGSNGWVISGKRTESGQVLFANDTHMGFSSPSVWYEAHLEYPGYSFYGNHLAGLPFGLVGHSRTHSVGLTMFENDDQDFFEEKINPSNPNQYFVGDHIFQMTVRKEKINIKGQESIDFEIRESIHGPIMNTVVPEIEALTQNPVASWWVYLLEPTRAIEAIYKINHAKSILDVAEAASIIHAPGLNIMYGDKAGNIAWWAAAKLPIRGENVHSKVFTDGSDPKSQPEGWYPFSVNPQSINPASGFVASANNQPDSMSNGVLYPGYYYPGDRYNRIVKTITSRTDWDLESIKSLQLETLNETHPENAGYMLSKINRSEFLDYSEILEELENWNGNHDLKSNAPTLFYKWTYHTLRLAMEDELGKEAFEAYLGTFMMIRSGKHFLRHADNPWWDNRNTEKMETKEEIIQQALTLSLKELTDQHGKNTKKWDWSKSIVAVHPHPLGAKKPLDKIFNVKTDPLPANEESINKLAFRINGEGIYKVSSGPAMRIILDFADVEKSVSVLPTGQSGNRFSKHYADQAKLYLDGKYRPQLMNESTIREKSKNKLVLLPK